MPPTRKRTASAPRHESRRHGGIKTALLAALLVVLLVTVAAPVALISALRFVPPPTTAFMLTSPTRPVAQQWVALSDIAPALAHAVVASEDQNFLTHNGFDFAAIRKVMAQRGADGPQRGASTISQQLTKNLLLWPGGGYARKLIEAGFTAVLEALWPKRRILEVYLNVAEFAPGVYGAEAAAQHYFGRPAAALERMQAARLAAVLPAPRRWRAEPPGDYVRERSRWIAEQMKAVAPALDTGPLAEG